jgi:DNA-binding IclR family transcriptional regulator
VPAGSRIVFIDRAVGSDILSVNTQIGAAEPLHCTALGKAYLAFCEPGQRDELIAGRLARFTPKTLVSRGELTEECERTRKRGYALDDEEYIEGIRCLAAPVLNAQAAPVALVGISGAKDRIRGRQIREYGEAIRRVSLEISAAFGYGLGAKSGTDPAGPSGKKGRSR